MKFNSQICTTKEQSERLLELGLKKETADMYYWQECDQYGDPNGKWHLDILNDDTRGHFEYLLNHFGICLHLEDALFISAWSLDRLMSLMPRIVKVDGRVYGCMMELGGGVQYINLLADKIIWTTHYSVSNSFDGLISCIEWLIKEGYFPKEYLV